MGEGTILFGIISEVSYIYVICICCAYLHAKRPATDADDQFDIQLYSGFHKFRQSGFSRFIQSLHIFFSQTLCILQNRSIRHMCDFFSDSLCDVLLMIFINGKRQWDFIMGKT